MSGNTATWCWDSYEDTTYIDRKGNEEECTDPWCRDNNGALARGGHWADTGLSKSVFGRGARGESIFTKNKYSGIRMVRNV